MTDPTVMKWLIHVTLAYRTRIGLILILQAGTAGLMSIQPIFFQKIVGLALGRMDPSVLSQGLQTLGLLLLIFLSVSMVQGLSGYLACIFSSDLLKRLQHEFFLKFSRLPLNYFRHQPAGEFITRLNMDIGQTQALISSTLPQVLREVLTLILAMVILLVSCSALLTLFALGVICLTSWFMARLNRSLTAFAREQRAAWGSINKVFDETIQGIDTVKTFAGEEQVRNLFHAQTGNLRKILVKAGTITAVFSPLIDLISKFGGLCLILLSFLLVFREQFAQEDFLLFFFYAGLFQNSISSLIQTFSSIQSQVISAGHLSSFLAITEEESHSRTGQTAVLDHSVPVRIQNLTFSYPKAGVLFQDFSLEAPANAITLVTGPTGSGKSTLINLLLGFYPPDQGRIQYGEKPIQDFTKEELRRKISVATQFHYIFQDTLKANLAIARPSASDQDIKNALDKAGLKKFTERLTRGMDEIMGSRGMGLSGGERQRICLARLFLRESPILILDEPWSSLDRSSQDDLIQVLHRCRTDTTVLILAHGIPEKLAPDRIYNLTPVSTNRVST